MKVQVRKTANVSILDCTGDVDLYTSTRLRDALLAEIRSGVGSVLVNMSGVGYIDSSGIATLVEALQLSGQTKTRLGLFGLRSNARSVLELARLHKVFNLFENEQEALEKIGSVQPFGGL
jgi:anti-sigma B factor antagonist